MSFLVATYLQELLSDSLGPSYTNLSRMGNTYLNQLVDSCLALEIKDSSLTRYDCTSSVFLFSKSTVASNVFLMLFQFSQFAAEVLLQPIVADFLLDSSMRPLAASLTASLSLIHPLECITQVMSLVVLHLVHSAI